MRGPEKRRTVPAIVAALILLAALPAAATIWSVNAAGTGDFPTIQAAIDAAMPGDEIVLADGDYQGEGNFSIDFLGKAIVLRSASGNPEACFINCDGGLSKEDCLRVGFLFRSGETAATEVRGVGVSRSYPPYFWGPECFERGSGATFVGSSPTLRNVAFRGVGGPYGNQDVLRVVDDSDPHLENIVVSETTGIVLNIREASATLTGGIITSNYGAFSCGTAVTVWNGTLQMESTAIRDHRGGAVHAFQSSVDLEGCAITAGSCDYFDDVLGFHSSMVTIDRCTVAGHHLGGPNNQILSVGDGSTVDVSLSIFGANCTSLSHDIEVDSGGSASFACTAVDVSRIGGGGVVSLSNIVAGDPGFCTPKLCNESTDGGLYSLTAMSAARDVPDCGTLGALYGVCTISVQPMTFGRIKAMYR